MARKLKNYQGGFSLIGIWPWIGVYAGATLILSHYIGLFLTVLITTAAFSYLAYLVEKAYPELNGLIDQPEEVKLPVLATNIKSYKKT